MQIDWWTLGIQAVNVLVLVFILGRFLFRPLAAIVEERRAATARQLDDARTAREAAEALRRQSEQAATEVAAARGEATAAAARAAEGERQAIVAAGREEADRLRAAAAADIAREREEATAAVSAEASRLALDIASRLLSRLPDEARVSGFVEGLVRGVRDLPETVRTDMGRDGAPIRLRAARALTDAELRECRDRLSAALERPVEIQPTVDPDLVAGIEIDMPHAAVRNSFRADLERIAAALAPDRRVAP